MAEPAILGGPPAFDPPLRTGLPYVPDPAAVLDRIAGALQRNWLTNFGPLVREFETRVAELAGVRHCVAMTNATAALQVLAAALELRGEVIVPSFTYVATPHALRWAGTAPVFADVDPATGNLDPAEVERLVTPATSGIVGVHVWGRPCAVDGLRDVADRHGLALAYDGAHAFGCGYRGRPIAAFGDATVFSFHATKLVNAFEGGAVVTDDAGLAEAVRSLHYFGFDDRDDVVAAGLNAKMTEASAAMGLSSLDALPDVLRTNREHAEHYASVLADVPGVRVLAPAPDEQSTHLFVVLDVDPEAAGLDRDLLAAALTADNVLVRKHFSLPCHRMRPYRDDPGRHVRRPQTHGEHLAGRLLQLPTGAGVTAGDVAGVGRLIGRLIGDAPRIRAGVGARVTA